ncbi:MAG: hypothetical protein GEU80_09150 [Dehalococcoidia bacterium]|nr:hypothetical protein [Dehalococcoidia bacterium]
MTDTHTQVTDATWDGQAELVDTNGVLIAQVAAELWKRAVEGRGVQWGGHITCPPGGEQHLPSGEYVYTLRLLEAQAAAPGEGAVVPRGFVRIALAESPAVERLEVTGQGAAPF